ncbi:MAG: TIGR01777 family oxidoreductase [Fimbriimonadaceae bacterium]|nr:TIGR01777 family oxidoreductase [Fimbriimonadaceae bacterium]
MKKVVIAGGTGFLGSEIVRVALGDDYQVAVLSRGEANVEGAEVVQWDGKTVGSWASALEGANLVINLSGAPLAKPWRGDYRKVLWSSRLEPTQAIGEAIQACTNPPQAWVNVSGIGIYGDTGDRIVTEASTLGDGDVAELAKDWEAAMNGFDLPQTTKAAVRMGMILGKGGGAWPPLSTAAKFGLGGSLGSGQQWHPWIHRHDAARLMIWVGKNQINGPVVGCAPELVRNGVFMAAVRGVVGRPFGIPAPGFALRALSALMEWPPDFLTSGQRAKPELATQRGFKFRFKRLQEAMGDLAN